MSMARGSRMLKYVNYRMRITLHDSRVLVGTFMAFDRHMNIVLAETEEFRKVKSKKGTGISEEKEEKRTLGLIILRGDSVVSMTVEGPPPAEDNEKLTPGGPGVGRAISRGLPIAPVAGAGLAGPVRGVGGPALSMMQPMQVAAQAQATQFARGFPMPPAGGVPMPPGMVPPRPPMPGMIPGMPMPGMPMPGMPPGMAFPPRGPPGMPGMMPPGMLPPGMMPPRGPM